MKVLSSENLQGFRPAEKLPTDQGTGAAPRARAVLRAVSELNSGRHQVGLLSLSGGIGNRLTLDSLFRNEIIPQGRGNGMENRRVFLEFLETNLFPKEDKITG